MLTYIYALAAVCVALFTAAAVMYAHGKGSRLSKEKDFFTEHAERVEDDIINSGIRFKMGWYYAILAAAPICAGALALFLTGSIPGSILCAIFGLFVPDVVIRVLKSRKDKGFEKDFLRSLEQMDASLRSGSSIIHAVEDTANCKFIGEEMKARYARLSSDMQMGIGLAEAFQSFASGTDNQDIKDVALAMSLQNEVGGHEADTVRLVANNIKERIATRKEINSLFSSTSSMLWMIDIFVPAVIVGFTLFNQSYVSVYFSSMPMAVLYFAFLGMSFSGTAVTHRMMTRVKRG